MLCVQKADGSSGSLWFSAGHKHILSHLAHFVQVQVAEHVLHTLVGAELLSLAAGGKVQDDADDDVDHEDPNGLAACIEGGEGEQHAKEEDHADDASPHSDGGSQLEGTVRVGHGLPQPQQGQRGDHPGQHEGGSGEAGHGVDHVGAEEGADEGEDQNQIQPVDVGCFPGVFAELSVEL